MIKKLKGTEDLLPSKSYQWQYVEEAVRAIFDCYQFKEIRTPMIESKALFTHSVGETTDIVTKEMYDFKDKGDRPITLRPEGTAPIVRAYVEHKLFGPEHPQPLKVYYIAPMFRYERPQSGRQRQFHQIGVEVFGSTNPATDAEVIALAWDILSEFDLQQSVELHLNSLGKPEDRQAYRDALVEYFTPLKDQLSSDSQKRLFDNPMRILDSKDPKDQLLVENAPIILDYLSQESRSHFEQVKELLTLLDIPFKVNSKIVRGLDYYQDTIFEFISTDETIGAQSTVIGGGRYDGLVTSLGGPETPSIGFGMGMERLMMLLQNQPDVLPEEPDVDLYVLTMGEKVNATALQIVQSARKAGYLADRDYLNRSLKSQFKTSDKLNAKVTLVLGEDELDTREITLKNKQLNKQLKVNLDDFIDNFEMYYRKMTMDTSIIDQYFGGER